MEAAERLARQGEAHLNALEEEEEEESAVTRVIRQKLGSEWIVADRSAPALEDGAIGAAEQRRDELRKKLKRERELEEAEAKAAAAEAESYGEGGGDVPISRVGRQNSRSLFAAAEQSLSSFSVLSEHSIMGAPAPKRQASSSVRVDAKVEAAKAAVKNAAEGGAGKALPPVPSMFAAATRGMAAGAGATTATTTTTTTDAWGDSTKTGPVPLANVARSLSSSAGSVGSGPTPVVRIASFQDRDHYSQNMLGQLGEASKTTKSKGFIWQNQDKSKHGEDAADDDDDGTRRAASARTRGGARPVAGGNKARTPLLPVAKSGGAAESGGSLLKTILNGGKSFGRVPKT